MLRNKKIIMLAMMLFGTFNFSSEAQAETCQGWVPISVDDINFIIPAWVHANDNTGFCLTITSHSDGDRLTTPLQTISGFVGDTVTNLTIDGQSVNIDNGNFSHDVSLAPSWNNIKFIVTDNNGTTASKILNIRLVFQSIDNLTFEDQNLANCVTNVANANGWVSASEILSLNCQNNNISSLDGIEALTELTLLIMTSNNISNINIISSLPALFVADFNYNNISSLSLYGTSIQTLTLVGNNIHTLNLNNLSSLAAIWLNNNQITDASSLISLPFLWILDLTGNNNIPCNQIDMFESTVPGFTPPASCL